MTKKRSSTSTAFFLLVIVIFFTKTSMHAQYFTKEGFGLKLSIIKNFGTHSESTGLNISGYYQLPYFQVNLSNQSTFSFYTLGKKKLFVQNKFSSGLVIFDKNLTTDYTQTQWDATRQQTAAKYSIGYAYIWYRDNRQTSQRSGAWGVQLNHFFVHFENDLFAGQGRDRFRTGQLEIDYFYREQYVLLGLQLWTGETRGAEWKTDSQSLHPYGYRDLSNTAYGKTSHGIFYVGFKQALDYENFAVYKLGLDDELIRHLFQNKLSHDLPFFPKHWKRNTPHYPMLQQNGLPIVFGGTKRKTKPFAEVGINSPYTY